ncbi:hypothetical protein PULV_a2895 [Pseudoalteromonas ulvae UL12]|nr:hypothetical protein [Pseudoalteromonas ulvae UL12]
MAKLRVLFIILYLVIIKKNKRAQMRSLSRCLFTEFFI